MCFGGPAAVCMASDQRHARSSLVGTVGLASTLQCLAGGACVLCPNTVMSNALSQFYTLVGSLLIVQGFWALVSP